MPFVSIRLILGLLFGSIGLLLVGRSARGVVRSYRSSDQAERVLVLSQANAPLFSTVTGERTTRNILGETLRAEAPIDPTIFVKLLENRRRGHAEMTETVRRLSQIDQPGLGPVSRDLQEAEQNYMTLVPRIDPALRLPKQARDPAITEMQENAQAQLATSIKTTNNFLETSMQMVDPRVDHLISLRQASRTLCAAAGAIISVIQARIDSSRPFTMTDLDALETERVRIDVAWSTLREAAARADAPSTLVQAIMATQKRYFGFAAGPQADWIATLRGGQILSVPNNEFQSTTAAALTPITNIADAAIIEGCLKRRTMTSPRFNRKW